VRTEVDGELCKAGEGCLVQALVGMASAETSQAAETKMQLETQHLCRGCLSMLPPCSCNWRQLSCEVPAPQCSESAVKWHSEALEKEILASKDIPAITYGSSVRCCIYVQC
jgi:hypothetical protein